MGEIKLAETQVKLASEAIRATTDASYRENSEVFYSIHELSRIISTYSDKAMAEAGITHVQWWALMHIYENEGLTQSDLAKLMQMGRASLGKLLERMEAKAWIERHSDVNDNRVRRVFVGSKAAPIYAVMTKLGRAIFQKFLAGTEPSEVHQLVSTLRKIRNHALDGSD